MNRDHSKAEATLAKARARLVLAEAAAAAVEAKRQEALDVHEALRVAVLAAAIKLAAEHFPTLTKKALKTLAKEDGAYAIGEFADAALDLASGPKDRYGFHGDKTSYELRDAGSAVYQAEQSLSLERSMVLHIAIGQFESEDHYWGHAEPSQAFEDFPRGKAPHPDPKTPYHAAYPLYAAMEVKYGLQAWRFHELAVNAIHKHLGGECYVRYAGIKKQELGRRHAQMLRDFHEGFQPYLDQYLGPAA